LYHGTSPINAISLYAKMMKYIFLPLLLLVLNISFAQCPTDFYLNYDQTDIDEFASRYPNCTSIDGRLIISNASDLSGLSQLRGVSSHLIIRNCDELKTLDGLDNIIFVGGNIQIEDNDSLVALYAFNDPDMVSVGGEISISTNPMLTTLEGFQSLSHIYAEGDFAFAGLWLWDNPSLIHLDEFSSLQFVGKGISIFGSDNLESIEGLRNIKDIPLDLDIATAPKLESLKGLENLQTVGGNIYISQTGIMDFDYLYSLRHVGGSIRIFDNAALESIKGLEGVDPLSLQGDREGYSEHLDISFNPLLETCASDFVCAFMQRTDVTYYINYNGEGCSSIQEIQQNCNSVSVSYPGEIIESIYPNPTSGIIYLESKKKEIVFLSTLDGMVIRTLRLEKGLNRIHLSDLNPGNYILSAVSSQAYLIQKY